MNGGYGSGGYPGPGYDEDPRRRQADGSPWGNDQGYDDRGYGGQGYGGYDEGGYDPRAYDQQGTGGYRPQGPGAQPGQYGGSYDRPRYDEPRYDQPQYDQRQGAGPRRMQDRARDGRDGRDARDARDARDGYDQRGGGRGQRGYNEWDSEDSDSSFMPGFGGPGDYNGGPGDYNGGRDDYDDGRYTQERGDRRAPRGGRPDDRGGRPDDRGPGRGDRGPSGRGPDQRPPMEARGDRLEDRRPLPDGDWDDRNRKPRKKVTRWFPRILVLAVVAVIVVGGLVGGLDVYHKYEARYHPADYAGPGTGDVVFHVTSGATAFSIAPELYQMGIIASERAFTNAAENATSTTASGGSSGGLEPGYYQLHYHMQASLAYAALINPKNAVQTAVTIPEGKRVSQTLTILAADTKIPLSQFQAAAKETSKLGLPSYAGTTTKLPSTVPYGQLEGYLFPATYLIQPHETALQILRAMVARFNVEAQQINIQQAAKSVGLTPSQLIIEASMVQAEAGTDSDMPKMASVMNNRKAAGMPYGFDSVVLYGLGQYGINITPAQAAAAGPYDNTQDTGLPPTPIDNPGNVAIQAVLHPVKSDWLYFLTVATGQPTEFSATCLPGTC